MLKHEYLINPFDPKVFFSKETLFSRMGVYIKKQDRIGFIENFLYSPESHNLIKLNTQQKEWFDELSGSKVIHQVMTDKGRGSGFSTFLLMIALVEAVFKSELDILCVTMSGRRVIDHNVNNLYNSLELYSYITQDFLGPIKKKGPLTIQLNNGSTISTLSSNSNFHGVRKDLILFDVPNGIPHETIHILSHSLNPHGKMIRSAAAPIY